MSCRHDSKGGRIASLPDMRLGWWKMLKKKWYKWSTAETWSTTKNIGENLMQSNLDFSSKIES